MRDTKMHTRFHPGDRVRLTEAALREFSEFRSNPYGVVVSVIPAWNYAVIRTHFHTQTWDLAWWEPAPELSPRAFAEANALTHLVVRE